jgi:hypothetical protein
LDRFDSKFDLLSQDLLRLKTENLEMKDKERDNLKTIASLEHKIKILNNRCI